MLETAQLVVIEDAERMNLPSVASIISDDALTIKEWSRPPRRLASCHRVMLFVKEKQPRFENAGRFYPIQCTETCMGTAEMTNALREVMTTPALDALRELLAERPVATHL